MRILRIDAWRDVCGWAWNNWHKMGDIEEIPETNRKILKLLRDEGYLSEHSKGRVAIEDDGYNVVVIEKRNRRPLLAIEYGNEEDICLTR